MTAAISQHLRSARWAFIVALVAATELTFAPRAQASLFGEENATLVAILTQELEEVAKAAEQVAELIQAVTKLTRMVQQGDTLLSKAADGSYADVLYDLKDALATYQSIDSDIKLIGYHLRKVDSEREQVYQDSYASTSSGDFNKHYMKWHEQLGEASAVAMRAQTNIETIEKRNKSIQTLQGDSQNTQGVVGQLQLVVRGIGVLHADLEALQRSLDTGMRVTSAMGAGKAAEAKLQDEDSTRMLKNYKYRGPKRVVPNKLP